MSTTTTKTVGQFGRDYTAIDNFDSGEYKDLAAASEILVAECYADSPDYHCGTGEALDAPWTTGLHYPVKIIANSAQKWLGEYASADTDKARLKGSLSSLLKFYGARVSDAVVEDMVFDHQLNKAEETIGIYSSNNHTCRYVFRRCLFLCTEDNNTCGAVVRIDADYNTHIEVIFDNCVFHNYSSLAVVDDLARLGYSTVSIKVRNCVFLGSAIPVDESYTYSAFLTVYRPWGGHIDLEVINSLIELPLGEDYKVISVVDGADPFTISSSGTGNVLSLSGPGTLFNPTIGQNRYNRSFTDHTTPAAGAWVFFNDLSPAGFDWGLVDRIDNEALGSGLGPMVYPEMPLTDINGNARSGLLCDAGIDQVSAAITSIDADDVAGRVTVDVPTAIQRTVPISGENRSVALSGTEARYREIHKQNRTVVLEETREL